MKKFLTLLFLCLILCACAGTKNKPSSIGIADYYALKGSKEKGFIDLGVKGYRQTTNYTCAPAVAMSILRFYGKLKDSDMNQETEMRLAAEMGASSVSGTSLWQLAHWLNKNGFEIISGEGGSLDMIKENLKKGIPVIVEWADFGTHWAIAQGYFDAGQSNKNLSDTIFFADPAVHWYAKNNPDSISSFSAERFNSMWFDAFMFNPQKVTRRIYIIATPKDKK